MTGEYETGIIPTPGQKRWMGRVGQKAGALATQGKLEFTPLSAIDRVKLALNPAFVPLVQRAIHEACMESGHDTQSYRPYVYRGDSASPYSPLTVRVIGTEDMPGLSSVVERGLIPGHNGFRAVDVYPPQE